MVGQKVFLGVIAFDSINQVETYYMRKFCKLLHRLQKILCKTLWNNIKWKVLSTLKTVFDVVTSNTYKFIMFCKRKELLLIHMEIFFYLGTANRLFFLFFSYSQASYSTVT